MSRTYKDRPFWVKRNDRSRPGRERHFHGEWVHPWKKDPHQSGPCTMGEEVTRDNVHDILCYWEPFDLHSGCSCNGWMAGNEGPRRSEERDVLQQYKKEHNSGEDELSFEDDVFSTNKRHDENWW